MESPKVWSIEYFLSHQSECLEELKKEQSVKLIPFLNYLSPDKLKNGTFLRFRGIIQDQLEPEFFLDQYQVKASDGSIRIQDGRFQDSFVLKTGENVRILFLKSSTNQIIILCITKGHRRTM